MGRRGPKSKDELAMAAKRLAGMELPQPPDYLSKDAKLEWAAIVESCPKDRFPRSTWPMLESYCTHAINVRRITQRLDKASADPDLSVKEYNQLLHMLNRESKTLASFGVRLGIARTSMAGRHNYDPAETDQGATPAPWKG